VSCDFLAFDVSAAVATAAVAATAEDNYYCFFDHQ
jgi:hypothetical protein